MEIRVLSFSPELSAIPTCASVVMHTWHGRRKFNSLMTCFEQLTEYQNPSSISAPTGKGPHACRRYSTQHFRENAWCLDVPWTTEMLHASPSLPRHIQTWQTPSLAKIFHSPFCSSSSAIIGCSCNTNQTLIYVIQLLLIFLLSWPVVKKSDWLELQKV
jgi:hypothetical protein